MMKLDLIIPTYNNKQGLFKTLFSIGLDSNVNITIVDDCSEETYDDIIDLFSRFFSIRVLKTPKNGGPGVARQFGLSHTYGDYVIFIDTGDVFYTPNTLLTMLQICENNPDAAMISFGHLEERLDGLNYVGPQHNRMHGKVYKRSFLKKYGISFNPETPRANEDIGFNMNCRLICNFLENQDDVAYCLEVDEPGVIWKHDENSITRNNDCAFYYKEQNNGLAHGALWAINNARRAKIDKEYIDRLGYDVMTSLYLFYISTVNRRPEFSEEALEGALFFYNNYLKNENDINAELLKDCYYNSLSLALNDTTDPIRDKLIDLNLIDFLNMLESMEEKE